MQLATLLDQYYEPFIDKFGPRLLPGHHRAISAITRCRTPQAGTLSWHCEHCPHTEAYPRSCGHRHCPTCQHQDTSAWLDRQRAKLLPVDYFMVTFTLPFEFRALAWHHQTVLYHCLFACAISTLKDFGRHPQHLGAELGLTAVLHTHSRRLDYHPHLHVIVPGGGIDRARRQWKKNKGKYLFNERALAKVFRARFLDALNAAGLSLPQTFPKSWVVNCTHVGQGKPALDYLSRYLYRGVISEHNLLANQDGKVTFKYLDGRSGETRYRTLSGEDFLWLVLQHVLPKGFRRVRDYGFLHGNAKKQLARVQLVLRVVIEVCTPRCRPVLTCPRCQSPMQLRAFVRPAWVSG